MLVGEVGTLVLYYLVLDYLRGVRLIMSREILSLALYPGK